MSSAHPTGELSASYATNSQLAIIEAAIDTISQQCDRRQILKALLPYALALAEVEGGALLVVGGSLALPFPKPSEAAGARSDLVVVARQGVPAEFLRELAKGPLAEQLLKGQQVSLEFQTLQLDPHQALLARYRLKYLLAIPLQSSYDVLGAVIVASHRPLRSLTGPELQQRLKVLAHLIGLFLDNTRLRVTSQVAAEAGAKALVSGSDGEVAANDLEELLAAVMSAEEEVVNQNKDLGLLNALSTEVGSTLQLSAVLQKAIQRTQSALETEAGWIYLFEDGALTLLEHQGLSGQYVQEMRRLKPGDGVEGMAFSRNEPFLRDALIFHSGKMRTLVEAEGLRAVAAVPLRAQGKPFGTLAVASHRSRDWNSRDERMLVSIGQQVSQAIVNSQLFTQVQTKAQTWETSYNTLQQANQQLTERAEVLEKQIQELRRIEQQIWTALAASQASRRRGRSAARTTFEEALSSPWQSGSTRRSSSQTDKQLAATLRRVLASMKKEK